MPFSKIQNIRSKALKMAFFSFIIKKYFKLVLHNVYYVLYNSEPSISYKEFIILISSPS